jgi:hypothetical protein
MGDGSFPDLKKRNEKVRQAVIKSQQETSVSQGEYIKKNNKSAKNKPTGLTHLESGWGKNAKE